MDVAGHLPAMPYSAQFATTANACLRILLFSDIHLEHQPNWSLPGSFPDYDVCVAAGDIDGSPARSIRRLASNPALRGKPIVFTPGNHEYYGNVLEDAVAEGRTAAVETGVHFLNADSVTIAGVRFIGATLWTDYGLHGDRELGMYAAANGMNDHKRIKRRAIRQGHRGKFKLAPKEAAWHHARQRAYIEDELRRSKGCPTIVVTHHAPSAKSLAKQNCSNPLNAAYASNLEPLIERCGPDLWVHGHIHDSVDYRVGNTWIRSNPKGYGPGGELCSIQNPAFDPQLIIELPLRNAHQMEA